MNIFLYTYSMLAMIFLYKNYIVLIMYCEVCLKEGIWSKFVDAVLCFTVCDAAWLISCRAVAFIGLILQVVGVVLVIILIIWVLCEAARWRGDEAGWCDRCIIYLTPIVWILAGAFCAHCILMPLMHAAENQHQFLAKSCNCIAEFVYCHKMLSVFVVCNTSVFWQNVCS